jgi:hypothetical protein
MKIIKSKDWVYRLLENEEAQYVLEIEIPVASKVN